MLVLCVLVMKGSVIFFFKTKTAYEMRISDWSSDVCSSDLGARRRRRVGRAAGRPRGGRAWRVRAVLPGLPVRHLGRQVGRGSGRRIAARPRGRGRTEESRVGEACVSTCRSRWSPYHDKNKIRVLENLTQNYSCLSFN